MDNRDVFLSDGALLPELAQFAGGGGVFGHDGHAAGFAVEAVDQTGLGAQIEAGAAKEAGKLAVLGGVADQAGGLVDDQQIGVLEEDVEKGKGRSDGVMEWWSDGRTRYSITPTLRWVRQQVLTVSCHIEWKKSSFLPFLAFIDLH